MDLSRLGFEVVFIPCHTPDHTPDWLSLLDRRNSHIFTGDTFYPRPIYLFTAETDFAAYAQSVAHLAQLVPDLKLFLRDTTSPSQLLSPWFALTRQ